jgi:hypothetical protein
VPILVIKGCRQERIVTARDGDLDFFQELVQQLVPPPLVVHSRILLAHALSQVLLNGLNFEQACALTVVARGAFELVVAELQRPQLME